MLIIMAIITIMTKIMIAEEGTTIIVFQDQTKEVVRANPPEETTNGRHRRRL